MLYKPTLSFQKFKDYFNEGKIVDFKNDEKDCKHKFIIFIELKMMNQNKYYILLL